MTVDIALTLLLAAIAAYVAIIRGALNSVFSPICVYWIVLTIKNCLLCGQSRKGR